ncbi:MAG: hypothetical protein E7058_04030 [Lentisphaerae bacterium]|nr:hypothetical protein [Lentisphaerota bacterium]
MKKLLFLLLFLLMVPQNAMADGISEMNGLVMKHLKIPFYKEKKIQLLIFSDSGQRKGRLMAANNTMLDMLLDNANVDEIPDGWQTKLYPLNSKIDAILEFWKPRVKISDAVIFTSSCSIDQKNEEVFGSKPVFLRTPMFDLDGEGFRANFRRQVIEVTSNVKIVVRDSDLDPRKILAGEKPPKLQRLIHATSDRLRIDRQNNKIMLLGNVKVIDGRNTLSCDRLTVFLDQQKSPSYRQKSPVADDKASLDGVSRVLADGNVLLIQRPEDPAKLATELQTSESEHLEYDVRREIIILTGDNKNPTLTRGSDSELSGKRIELLRNEDKMFVMRDCRITSLVRDEKGMLLYARRINSDRANFDGKSNVANFHGSVVATDQSATLHTDSLRAHLIQDQRTSSHKIELLFANGNVRIINRSEKNSPDIPGQKVIETSTIHSQQAELNYRDNKLVFYRTVKIRDSAAALDCDRLDIFLADRSTSLKSTEVSGAPMAAGMEGKNKTITKLMAMGDVYMVSRGDEIQTDLLTLLFRDLPEGAKPSPGMIQSGGVQLIKILCDGSVTATSPTVANGQKTLRKLKAANGMSDLLKDYSEFHGNVNIVDGNTEISCDDMYIFTGASPINEEIVENIKVQKPQKNQEQLDEEALDADPFAVDMGEDSVPTRIAITDSRDLKRIVCQKKVALLRRDDKGQIQRAGGDRAVYTVNTREVVLTAERPKRPWLRANGRKQSCDIICSDMETQDLRGIGNVIMVPDDGE